MKSRKTGKPWLENGKLVWTDPSNPKVQEYDIALAKHATESGVDEIQFDYVRFPAEGDQKDAQVLLRRRASEVAAHGRDHRLPVSGLRGAASDGRAALARRVRRDGLAAQR